MRRSRIETTSRSVRGRMMPPSLAGTRSTSARSRSRGGIRALRKSIDENPPQHHHGHCECGDGDEEPDWTEQLPTISTDMIVSTGGSSTCFAVISGMTRLLR